MWFRCMGSIMLASTTLGCGQYGVSGPDDLGLAQKLTPTLQIDLPISDSTPLSAEVRRNQELSKWLVRSDYQCNKYLAQLSRGIRDSRLATDVVATVLSGLATILAPVGTKTALSGAATITLGVGGDIQSELFAQQAGEVVSSAVQAVRIRARIELQKKMQGQPYATYTLEQGLVDVQRYDQETCNLNVGLNELRASLIVGPGVKRPNDPILPLPPPIVTPPPPVGFVPPIGVPPPPVSPPPPPVRPGPRRVEHVEPAARIPVGTLTPDQIAFDAAIGKLKHDPAKPEELVPESRQIVDECIQPQFRKGTSLARVMLTAKADLPKITSCIVSKSQ